ncbi:Ig-like domain-containing protein [Anaerocolumna sp.]|uniref:Ig-like domain-containing protein n=1 Tax=Anaerocolumna sp. TaxID=2041569 RepID=UPI0028AFEEE7|nr:Ig-like domain-containing protein [Anaerocolumna sp.]
MLNIKKVLLSILLSYISILFILPSQPVKAISTEISFIILSQYEKRVTISDEFYIIAITSTGKKATWKSSDSKIASVNKYGKVTAKKTGSAVITASIKGAYASCLVTVDPPTITLSQSHIALYRSQSAKLSAKVSSKVKPKWKTSKKSVATVDQNGNITAVKNGTAVITATVNGVSDICEVTVKKPVITLSTEELTIKTGSAAALTASVSSGNSPAWSTSNPKIISINSKGQIRAIKKGRAYIYAKEDGAKARCTIYVTD